MTNISGCHSGIPDVTFSFWYKIYVIYLGGCFSTVAGELKLMTMWNELERREGHSGGCLESRIMIFLVANIYSFSRSHLNSSQFLMIKTLVEFDSYQ